MGLRRSIPRYRRGPPLSAKCHRVRKLCGQSGTRNRDTSLTGRVFSRPSRETNVTKFRP
ncbi:hypothetical protein DPMN_130117 [Dreissena polymorpha]|uniref:Uncharacterized protein n=1 Tax=Dreissena polymorpha TaxID=45954 RepID=A0A9D4H749_DREPO|nr:hypothetical protein DPMN_130117 [Dreissena polymorpha]